MKKPGMIVKSVTGLKGIVYNVDKNIEGVKGKLLVYVLNQDMTPSISSISGKQRKLLIKSEDLSIIGYVD